MLEEIKKVYKNFTIKIIKYAVIAMIVIILLVTIAVLGVKSDKDDSSSEQLPEDSQINGEDYIVNTSMSDSNIVIKDKTLLENGINSLPYSDSAKQNLISTLDVFLACQDTYNVNAVFAIAVTIKESSAGTGWDLIDPSTYNWYSIKAGSNWTGNIYTDRNGTNWRAYNNFEEAIVDFATLISGSSYYFAGGNNTVMSIAPHYCNNEWGIGVIGIMEEIFRSMGIEVNNGISNSSILATAAKLIKQIQIDGYTYGASSIPPKNKIIDCSSFVDWVLYEMGYTEFGGAQKNTYWWYYNFKPESKGWTWFYINGDISKLQPGDIIVYNNGGSGHMQIFAGESNGRALVYDCGDASNWANGGPIRYDYYKTSGAKAIRISN